MTQTGVEAAKATLVDKVRDEVLAALQELPDAWQKLGEVQQRDWIERAALIAGKAVCDCCDVIAADGRTVLDGTVGNVTAKKTTYEGSVTVSKEAVDAIEFIDAAHGAVQIAFVERSKYTAETTRPQPTPDQGQMFNQPNGSDTAKAIGEGIAKVKKRHEGLPDPEKVAKATPRKITAKTAVPPKPVKRRTVRTTRAGKQNKEVKVEERKSFDLVE